LREHAPLIAIIAARRVQVRRMQYLLCTAVVWTVLRQRFLHPAGFLTGLPDPFVPLFRYLDAVPESPGRSCSSTVRLGQRLGMETAAPAILSTS
jgi:hypothetical protein